MLDRKILFDLSSTQESPEAKFHGGGEYAKQIFDKAVELNYAAKMVCFYNDGWELDENIRNKCLINNIEIVKIKDNNDINNLLQRSDIYGFYSAIPYHYHSLNIKNKRFIGTIHGLRDIECPGDIYEYKYRRNFSGIIKAITKRIIKPYFIRIREAKENLQKIFSYDNVKIITVSIHSKYSILSNFPELEDEQIIVINSPYAFIEHGGVKDIGGFNYGKYYLLISANRWIKNSYRAIQALDQLFTEKRISDHTVIVTGCKGYNLLERVNNPDRFVFMDYVTSNELDSLFKNATCFIYPTLNEGYGYPPLKAFEFGVPVLASGNTSIFEVCENSAIYFNPYSVSEIKTRILNLHSDYSLRSRLIENGHKTISKLKDSVDKAEETVNEIFRD